MIVAWTLWTAHSYVGSIIARITLYVKLSGAIFAPSAWSSHFQNQSRRQKTTATESDIASAMARTIQNAAGHSWNGNATFIP